MAKVIAIYKTLFGLNFFRGLMRKPRSGLGFSAARRSLAPEDLAMRHVRFWAGGGTLLEFTRRKLRAEVLHESLARLELRAANLPIPRPRETPPPLGDGASAG